MYQVLWQPVDFTVNVQGRRSVLLDGKRPDLIGHCLRKNAQRSGCGLIAYCVMPDHVHVVACVSKEDGDLVEFIERFKRDSGYGLSHTGVETPVWQRSYWDRHLRKHESLSKLVGYVLANPVRRGLCEDCGDWPYGAFVGYPWEKAGPS